MALQAPRYSESHHSCCTGAFSSYRIAVDVGGTTHPLYVLPIVLFIRMALNALDGMLARECNQQTRLGAILNETGDVISDIALYLPFLFLPESNASLVILMLFCTILTEFCGLLAQTINGVRSYAGPFGKSDRALIFGLWGLAVAIYPQWMQWNNLLWSIASILLLWTAINRCRSVLLMSAER